MGKGMERASYSLGSAKSTCERNTKRSALEYVPPRVTYFLVFLDLLLSRGFDL